jgi:hypothetical protein
MNRAKMALALVVATLAVESASAQQYQPPATSPYPQPAISPFITLGRGSGINPGIAYFGIVQPTQELYNFEATQLNRQQQQANTAGRTGQLLPQTGNSSRFMAYSGYFNNVGGRPLGVPVPPPGYNAPVPLGGRGPGGR